MLLYHSITSYHLLNAILHKLKYNPNEYTVLILPDFITSKYPYYKLLENNFFDKVLLFPYLKIPHTETTIRDCVKEAYESCIGFGITSFSKIYIAGTHFYFTDYLLARNIKFSCFEEACGLYSRCTVLEDMIVKNYPIQYKWAKTNGLLDYSNNLIDEVFLQISAQENFMPKNRCINFSTTDILQTIGKLNRENILKFFTKKIYFGGRKSVILLTEQFANLGCMSELQQKQVYLELAHGKLKNKKVVVKPHPDDNIDYREIFPDAEIITEKFPSELLPFVFLKKPRYITTLGSTGIKSLKGKFLEI